jgi:hypothetical protein
MMEAPSVSFTVCPRRCAGAAGSGCLCNDYALPQLAGFGEDESGPWVVASLIEGQPLGEFRLPSDAVESRRDGFPDSTGHGLQIPVEVSIFQLVAQVIDTVLPLMVSGSQM